MTLRRAAFAAMVIGMLSFGLFFVRLGTGRLTDLDLFLNFVATSATGWGVTLLLVHDRMRSRALAILVPLTCLGFAITVALALGLPG